MANIIATHLTDFNSNATASADLPVVTPRAGRLQLLVVSARRNDGAARSVLPTITGCNLTWANVLNFDTSSNFTNRRLTVWRATGSPTTGQINVQWGGQSNLCEISLEEFGNVDLSGINGENAIVQTSAGDGASSMSFSRTLSALGDAKNAAYGFGYQNAFNTLTKGASFSQLVNSGSGGGSYLTEWGINQTTVNWSSNGVATWYGCALELKFKAPPGGAFLQHFL